MPLPTAQEYWGRHRDGVNIVMGGILGGFLGLSISRDGIPGGGYGGLFALIITSAISTILIIEILNRYYEENRIISILYTVALFPSVGMVYWSAERLDIDGGIIITIYAAWFAMVVCLAAAFEVGKSLEKRAK